jgi:hypothetical protein
MEFYQKIFDTDSYLDVIAKDPSVAKAWPATMGATLVKEANLFINDVVVKEDGGLNQLLTAPYAFVNADTAPFYNVPAPSGSDFVKTNFTNKQRMGLLTQVGFLARRSMTKDSNAIRRGAAISGNLLCAEIIEKVPENIPPLPAVKTGETARQGIETTTGAGTCGGICHSGYINPSGFPFENYDAAGNFRTMDNGKPVDSSGSLIVKAGMMPYTNAQTFLENVTKTPDLHQCMVAKAIGLLYAREVDPQDQSIVSVLASKSAHDLSTRDLFYELLIDSRIKVRGNKK